MTPELGSIRKPHQRYSRLRGMCVAAALGALLSVPFTAKSAFAETLQFATMFPESDFSSEMVKRWTDGVTERTDGRIQFRVHWGGSLVPSAGLLDGLRDGTIDAALQFSSYVSGEIIDLAVLEVPFSWPQSRDGSLAFHQEVTPIVDDIYSQYGSRVVSAPPVLLPNPLTCTDRFLSGPDKWSGALVRTAGRWQGAAIERMGGSPVVMGFGDVYSALERGTINCTLAVYNFLYSVKLYEPAKYVTRLDHSIAFGSINVSNITWDRLSEEDQKIMREVGDEVMIWGHDEFLRRYEETLDLLAAEGVKFCTPDDSEFARLIDVADSLIADELTGNVSADGTRLLEVVERFRPQVTARPEVGDVTSCP